MNRPVAVATLATLLVAGLTTAAVAARGGSCAHAFAALAPAAAPSDVPDPSPGEAEAAPADVAALTAGGQRVAWTAKGDSTTAGLAVGGSVVVLTEIFSSEGFHVRAFDPATGTLAWQRLVPATRTSARALDDATAVTTGTGATGGRTGTFRIGVIDRGGRLVACRSFGGDDADSTAPHVATDSDGHRLVVAAPVAGGSRVELFEGSRLERRWAVTVRFHANDVTLAGDLVLAHTSTGSRDDDVAVMALTAATGAERWRRTIGDLPAATGRPAAEARVVFDAAVVGDRVLLTAGHREEGLVNPIGRTPFALAAADGAPVWQRPDVDVDRLGRVAPAGDVLVATSTGGTRGPGAIAGLDARTGADRWHIPGYAFDPPVAGAHGWFLAGVPRRVDPATGAVIRLADRGYALAVVAVPGFVVWALDSGVVVALDDPA